MKRPVGAKGPGAKRPEAKRPGGETSRGGNGLGAKRPGTIYFANKDTYTISFRLTINSISGACNSLTHENAINETYSTLTLVTVSQFVMRPNYEKINE